MWIILTLAGLAALLAAVAQAVLTIRYQLSGDARRDARMAEYVGARRK